MIEFVINAHHIQIEPPTPYMVGLVQSQPKSYPVLFSDEEPADWLNHCLQSEKEAFYIFDKKVYELYFDSLHSKFFLCIEANESNKSMSTTLDICNFLEQHAASKGAKVFIIGGGIIQDIGGFACAIYKRGINYHLFPTTLLAQSDSCIGAKLSLNFEKSKNTLGLYYSPASITINTGFLQSLHYLDIYSGIGEIFKLHIIAGLAMIDTFEEKIPILQDKPLDVLDGLITNSLIIKKSIIELDEFENDIRKALNYGHSFGHALEALSNYAIPHGIAVTIGILIENEISKQLGYLEKTTYDRIQKLAFSFIPNSILQFLPKFYFDQLLHELRMDKKTIGSNLKLTCLMDFGNMRFVDILLDSSQEEFLQNACQSVFHLLFNQLGNK